MPDRNLVAMIVTGATLLGLGAAQADAATVAYWRFEPGALTVDSSPNGHTLVNHGGVASSSDTPGFGAGSAQFDGVDDGFATASTLDLTGATSVTIEFFAKPLDSLGSVADVFLEHSANAGGPTPGAFLVSGEGGDFDELRGFQRGINDPNDASDSYLYMDKHNGIVDSAWQHYAVTIDGSASGSDHIKLFINHQQVGSNQFIDDQIPAFINDFFYIGARAPGTGSTNFHFGGLIDELRISDQVLTPSQFLTIPEPASLGLMGLGGALLLGRRR